MLVFTWMADYLDATMVLHWVDLMAASKVVSLAVPMVVLLVVLTGD